MGERTFTGLEELTNALAKKRDITKKEAYDLVKDFIEVMKEEMLKEDNRGIQLVNFLTLTKVVRKAKLGRNPKNPTEEFHIPERNSLRLTVGKEFSEELSKINI